MTHQLSRGIPAPVCIAGVPVHPIRLQELLLWLSQRLSLQQQTVVMYCNVYAVNIAQRHQTFRAAMKKADIIFCDGYGVRIAATLLQRRVPERFTPPDWIDQLLALCAQNHYRIFLLGGKPGVATGAIERLHRRFPEVQMTAHHGYFACDGNDNAGVLRAIHTYAPHILLVGMGMPRQEEWIYANQAYLSVPLIMTVGALFDYLAEEVPRGPRWLTDNGFEWLCRLIIEPRRLWRRYLLGNPYFAWLVARQMLHAIMRYPQKKK
jgi:N-acetylglucosaminyldiphosphoundecaprenol N-acetyl-beta-D-mannosaminyltransferase